MFQTSLVTLDAGQLLFMKMRAEARFAGHVFCNSGYDSEKRIMVKCVSQKLELAEKDRISVSEIRHLLAVRL